MSINTVNAMQVQPAARGTDVIRQVAVVLATIVTITVNVLANALPINGQRTGEISDRFPVFFVPAGYVFSIWLVIYIGLAAYTVFQALPAQRANPRLQAIGWWYVLSAAANSVWIFLWHYNLFVWSVVVMLALLASLLVVYLRLAPTRRQVARAEWWTTNLPFSVYLGWITVATVANITAALYYVGWNGGFLPPEWWAALMMVVATALGVILLWRYRDFAYALVLVWAIAGIAVKQSAAPVVAGGAWVLVAVLAAALGWFAVRRPAESNT
jgi:hypothetical protein